LSSWYSGVGVAAENSLFTHPESPRAGTAGFTFVDI
jgi:hypothetical protein